MSANVASESIDGTSDESITQERSRRVVGRLKFYFASLSCLGGIVLGAGNDIESITVIAVFFAVVGYVFVDWLELFALPPVVAYAAMAVAALYCVSDFSDLNSPGNRQMVAVAQLLVFVQAILMLQRKSRRIFEQLGVFCLLQLIVAAVFNNAISYGVLLIPISVIAAWALSLLSALSTWEGLQETDGITNELVKKKDDKKGVITVSATESARSLAASASRLPRIALFAMAPSVMLVAAIFFYALPRTTDAARMSSRGAALVGFSEQLRLEQIGHMMQSSEPALRIHTQDASKGDTYFINSGIYLRGKVLERYQIDLNNRGSGSWTSIPASTTGLQRLPAEFTPIRTSDRSLYDTVNFHVICESMRSSSLFAVAPYHRRGNDRNIFHGADRWTLSRRQSDDWTYPRLSYSFGSNAFRNGNQSDVIARYAVSELSNGAFTRTLDRRERVYQRELLSYDVDLIPTAKRLADKVAELVDEDQRNVFTVSKAIEEYLSQSGGFSYTLNLNAEPVPGLDPLEQFLAKDRRGHCQYFASALVMMLRSQGIPARVVVGYRTDEYNELGQYYVARQLHAHAWVEALVQREDIPANRLVYGQPNAGQYWLRLDPTPGGGGVSEDVRGVRQVFDLAQNIWDDYVVDMDSKRQDDAILNATGMTPMSDSYSRLIRALSDRLARVRAGDLGGGSLASRRLFSWPAAVAGVILAVAILVLFKIKTPVWIRRRLRRKMSREVARPSVAFYAETLEQLERVGVNRDSTQTPVELAQNAEESLSHPLIPSVSEPLRQLTTSYYRVRFGDDDEQKTSDGPVVENALAQLTKSVDLMVSSSTAEARS